MDSSCACPDCHGANAADYSARNNGDELPLLEELERITRRKLEFLTAGR